MDLSTIAERELECMDLPTIGERELECMDLTSIGERELECMDLPTIGERECVGVCVCVCVWEICGVGMCKRERDGVWGVCGGVVCPLSSDLDVVKIDSLWPKWRSYILAGFWARRPGGSAFHFILIRQFTS